MLHHYRNQLARVVVCGGALCLLGMGGSSADANQFVPAGPVKRVTVEPVVDVPADGRNRVVLHLVDKHLKTISYDNTVEHAPAQTNAPFTKAILNDAWADRRYIIFESTDLVKRLSHPTKRTLRQNFEKGEWIIGAKGFGRDLKAALGLLEPELAEAGTSTGGAGLWVLLYRSPKGFMAELTVAAAQDEESLGVAYGFISDWQERNENFITASDSDDPWDAIHNFEWSGTTTGSFKGSDETVGTYKYTLSAYTLGSDQDGDDWYRLDFQTISEITNYEMTGDKFGDTSGNCGWWTQDVWADATVTTPGGQWWEYMPDTTVGSTSTSFTIGGDISTGSAGVTGAYSQSYGTSDVTITVEANSVTQAIDWQAALVGCHNYSYYPDYSGASNAAKTTYNLNPSFIIAVPAGATMQFTTGGDEAWGFQVRKDHIYICNLVEICSTEYKEHYTNVTSHSCTKTQCS